MSFRRQLPALAPRSPRSNRVTKAPTVPSLRRNIKPIYNPQCRRSSTYSPSVPARKRTASSKSSSPSRPSTFVSKPVHRVPAFLNNSNSFQGRRYSAFRKPTKAGNDTGHQKSAPNPRGSAVEKADESLTLMDKKEKELNLKAEAMFQEAVRHAEEYGITDSMDVFEMECFQPLSDLASLSNTSSTACTSPQTEFSSEEILDLSELVKDMDLKWMITKSASKLMESAEDSSHQIKCQILTNNGMEMMSKNGKTKRINVHLRDIEEHHKWIINWKNLAKAKIEEIENRLKECQKIVKKEQPIELEEWHDPMMFIEEKQSKEVLLRAASQKIGEKKKQNTNWILRLMASLISPANPKMHWLIPQRNH